MASEAAPMPFTRAPTTPDGLTAAWLEMALQPSFPGLRVERLTRAEPLFGTATKIRLEADYAGVALPPPRRLVIKGGFAAHREAMAYLYARETRFYRDLQPALGVNSPACFGVVDDVEGHQHIAILEDLTARGVRFCRVETPLSVVQAKGFLDILARLHARTWSTTPPEPGSALAGLPLWEALPAADQGGAYAQGQLEPEVWARYMALPRCLAVPRMFHDRERMRAGLEALNRLCRALPRCLLHADFHLGNLYLDADGWPGVLDWQSYSQGHWSHDVTYFLVSALDPVDRRQAETALVQHYLAQLAAEGVAEPPTPDQAMAAFRLQIMDGLFYWMVNPPEWQSEANNCAVAPRFALAALDHRTYDAF
jgi:hypothetical protein